MEKIEGIDIRNLVLEGGGVLGAAELGAYLHLQSQDVFSLSSLERIAGTSAGSILASAIALGASSSFLLDLVHNCPFSSFTDAYPGLITHRLLTRYGIYRGDKFRSWFESEIISSLGYPKDLTFSDLSYVDSREGNKRLDIYIIAYNLDKGQSVSFSFDSTPEVRLSDAVRASMSIPLFFAAHRINGDLYVDGGVTRNYPIRAFDDPITGLANPHTLGIRVDSSAQRANIRYASPVRSILSFCTRLISVMHEATSGTHLEPQDWNRTVWCDSLGIPATKFDLSRDEVGRLLESGKKGAQEWIEWRTGH